MATAFNLERSERSMLLKKRSKSAMETTQAGPQDESRFQIHNAGGIAMALMDSELIYGQKPWAIVTFLQAGFKGNQRLIHDMLLYFLYGTLMYREHGRSGRNGCMTLKQMDNPQGHIPSNACERALAGDIFRYGLPAGCAAESVPENSIYFFCLGRSGKPLMSTEKAP